MDKKEFIKFLENKKKSERTIKTYTDFVQQYETYLFEHKNRKKLEQAGKKELHDFEKWAEKNDLKINRYLWGIKEYYDFISKEALKLEANAMIGGHKKVRARLYHKAGFDTIDKMAACDPAEMRQRLADFIKKTGFKGIPPTPGEARNTVTMAKYIKRLVQY